MNDAAAGCDFIMHVASPYILANPKNPNECIAYYEYGSYCTMPLSSAQVRCKTPQQRCRGRDQS
ncbi:hypothetical protein N8Z77_05340 [Planktomarina sp.]|nr:hypothetical protein [Planktomarina sp.]